MTEEPNRLFERFRRAGDTEALGRVFDATAPRLLQLAIHLVGDLAAAEDLVQATFVTAIERAPTFDASRGLEAWLAGILANHARDLNKSARREIDAAALVERIEATPLEQALDAEWSAALAQALDRVPEPYRVALILRLQHGMEPTEIAHALQRSPGTVRVQLHRGREMLRKLLPAGIVASALFIAEPARGLAQVKSHVIAQAALVKSTVGIAGVAGVILMSTKVFSAATALVVALIALFFLRVRSSEQPSENADAARSSESVIDAPPRNREGLAPADAALPARREEVASAGAATAASIVKLHGRVVDAETDQGIGSATVELFAPRRMSLLDIRSKWPDRLGTSFDGSLQASSWPRFGVALTEEAAMELEDVEVYAPAENGVVPIARTITNPKGEFEIVAPKSLGFMTCTADGYAPSHRALTPERSNSSNAAELSLEIAMRAPRHLFGYVVDDDLKRIERRIRLVFMGRMRLDPGAKLNSDGTAIRSFESDKSDPQVESWVVETKPDGGFECELPAMLVFPRSLEPDLEFVRRGCLRENGTKLVDDVWPQPGMHEEPFVIVMRPVTWIAVRDRATQIPIENIHLLCSLKGTGQVRRHGAFFARQGYLRLTDWGSVHGGTWMRDEEREPCECTVWAEGYLPVTHLLPDLIQSQKIEFELERGEAPALSGRVHEAGRAVAGARISLCSLRQSVWRPPVSPAIAMTKSDSDGTFHLPFLNGRYVMTITIGDQKELRLVELPCKEPVDVDWSIHASIVAEVRNASGAVAANRPLELRGPDGRILRSETDGSGMARFERLPAGPYVFEVRNVTDARFPKPDQSVPVDLQTGEEKHLTISLAPNVPVFPRLVVDELRVFKDWKACVHHEGQADAWVDADTNGRIPLDIRGISGLRIVGAGAREWNVVLPVDAPDGYEIRLALDGRGYDGVVTSQATGLPLAGLRVLAWPLNAAERTTVYLTAVTDANGYFKMTGLVDDDYSMRFEDVPRDGAHENFYIRPTARPGTPLIRLELAVPRDIRGRKLWYGAKGFEGFEPLRLTGTVRKRSGTLPAINGHIFSIVERAGYTMRLFTRFSVASDGSYAVSAPSASRYGASLSWDTLEKGHEFTMIEWESSGARDHEVHDIELP